MAVKPYTILIVDDSRLNIRALSDVLENSGYRTIYAMNGKQALEEVARELPDLILMDVVMPEMDGYETCARLKSHARYKDIPVIFLTSRVRPEDIAKGFQVGGVDYISKPFNNLELNSRIKTHLELKRARDEARDALQALSEANKAIERQNAQLNQMVKKLEHLSKTDYLTDLPNRRSMIAEIQQQMEICQRDGGIFCLFMADIDHFKSINDTYGHDFGDFVVRKVSELMAKSLPKDDVLARWGGEEFLILLKNTSLAQGADRMEQIRQSIGQHTFRKQEVQTNITMTFGGAAYSPGDSIDDIIKKADNALYMGKRSGRNIVVTLK